MILVDLPAKMKCSEPSCEETSPVQMCLLTSGGFGFAPSSKLWQITTDPRSVVSPYNARCPLHAVKIQPAVALAKG